MSTATWPPLAVLVVNYGSHALLRRNLAPLVDTAPDAFAVVVDNRTDNAERHAVHCLALEHNWYVQTPDSNLGFGAGMNLAAARAQELGARHILLLNPDAALEPQDLARLRQEVVDHPWAMVSPTVLRPDGSTFFAGIDLCLGSGRMRSRGRRPAFRPERRPAEIRPWLSGACLILDMQLWTESGGFDDDYFLYWEDVDLSHRVVEVGGELRVLSDALARHDEGATSKSERSSDRSRSDTYYYYNIRNRLVYARKHLAPADRLRWAMLSPVVASEILLQGGRRQFLHSLLPVRTAAHATVDGLLIVAGLRQAGARRS